VANIPFCLPVVSERPDQCDEAGGLGRIATRRLPDDLGPLAPGVGEGCPGAG